MKDGFVYGYVYEEIKVQSMYNPTTKYVIRCGDVSWGEMETLSPLFMF